MTKEDKLLKTLKDTSLYRIPSSKVLKEKAGLSGQSSLYYALKSLQKKGLIDSNYKPIYSQIDLKEMCNGTGNFIRS